MTTPEPTTPETPAPEATTPEPTAPETPTPEPTTPEATAPEATTAGATSPGASAPEASAPGASAPEKSTQEKSTQEKSAPEKSAQEKSAQEKSTPEANPSEASAPEPGEPEPAARPWTRVEPLADTQAVAVRVGGDIDHNTAEVLDEGLDEGLAKAIEAEALLLVVDLREVGFVASTGLSSLIRVHNAAKDKGLDLVVALPEEHRLSRLLWLTALSRILTVTNSVEEALKQAPRNPA
ncbi:STAS domain-containing protein [Actinosynnema sp. NPDC059797]